MGTSGILFLSCVHVHKSLFCCLQLLCDRPFLGDAVHKHTHAHTGRGEKGKERDQGQTKVMIVCQFPVGWINECSLGYSEEYGWEVIIMNRDGSKAGASPECPPQHMWQLMKAAILKVSAPTTCRQLDRLRISSLCSSAAKSPPQ